MFKDRLRKLIKRFWLDLRAGKCSGFPNCCIIFYSTLWKIMYGSFSEDLYSKSAWRSKLILRYHKASKNAGYVPCPFCLISGARVRVNFCTDSCGHRQEGYKLH